jgi:hypothetical protein
MYDEADEATGSLPTLVSLTANLKTTGLDIDCYPTTITTTTYKTQIVCRLHLHQLSPRKACNGPGLFPSSMVDCKMSSASNCATTPCQCLCQTSPSNYLQFLPCYIGSGRGCISTKQLGFYGYCQEPGARVAAGT